MTKRNLTIIFLSFVGFLFVSCSVSKNNKKNSSVIELPKDYIINKDINLNGRTVNIPSGTVLKFNGGSICNGTLSGKFSVTGKIKQNTFSVSIKDGSSILSTLPIYNYSTGIVRSQIKACNNGITLMEDVNLDNSITLSSSINGNGHKLYVGKDPNAAVYIQNSRHPITISNLTLTKGIEKGTINKNLALHILNSSNVTITNCVINGRVSIINNTQSESDSERSKNFVIKKSTLNCDLTDCPQGWENGQDHVLIKSISDITIVDCIINSTNVNRVFKTTAYFPEKKYEKAVCCTDNILFQNNKVMATAVYGKQVWDMFCGTTNVTIEHNTFNISGFTRFIEDKAYQPKYKGGHLLKSKIVIKGNSVNAENADLFQFKANIDCDIFEVTGNTFTMGGANKNTTSGYERASAGIHLQGYKKCIITDNKFTWKDEAVGFLFAMVNFTCDTTIITNNQMLDAYRVYFNEATSSITNEKENAECTFFEYKGNCKTYTKQYSKQKDEVIVSNTFIRKANIIFNNSMSIDYPITLGKGSKIDSLKVSSPTKSNHLVKQLSNSVVPYCK